mgnify:FL=1|tara:strand:- start:287 stop:691 length:405 start_codon:yes stop_codon:yes gene_type:complete
MKKKFKDTKVGSFLLEKIPNIVGSIAGDTPVGNVVRSIIGGSDMSEADKEIALKKLDQEIHEFDGITKRWVADSSSTSWLAKNVRPLTLLFLTIAFVIGWYMQIEELEIVKELLWVVFAGYFGGRTYEKVKGMS